MPTLLALDCSLSMLRFASPPPQHSSDPSHSLLDLAKHGLDLVLANIESSHRLEHVSLVCCASDLVMYTPFTRDVADVRKKLMEEVDAFDTCNMVKLLRAVVPFVNEQWGAGVEVKIVLVTDAGLGGHGQYSLPGLLRGGVPDFDVCFPFPFRGQMNVVCLAPPSDRLAVAAARTNYERLIEKSGLGGGKFVAVPSENTTEGLSVTAVEKAFRSLIADQYCEYRGILRMGAEMSTPITLSPPPAPYKETRDFDVVEATISNTIDVLGFLTIAEVASPPLLSRHLILPAVSGTEEETRNAPNLCVFLHGGLKPDNLCALVKVADNWYGIIFPHSDNKKKSCIMLALFDPGPQPVPWLGDLRELGPLGELNAAEGLAPFPVKGSNKPSYSSAPVVWIKLDRLHFDVQKVLRQARKMPEKSVHFYRELNRLKKAALCIGFHGLLEGIAMTFERECQILPDGSHPDCALQLTHAAGELRRPEALELEFEIRPMRTKFS